VALLLFSNCSKNIYYLLGPGTTPQQAASLQHFQQRADSIPTRALPPVPGQPTARQRYDSIDDARRRLLRPAQYTRYQQSILLPRYPRRPPKGHR
jgi:hypothetical protein